MEGESPTLSSFLTKFRSCRGKLITIKPNEKHFGNMSVKGLKMTLACWIWFSLVTRLAVTWVGTSTSRICASGLRFSPMSIPIALLAKSKWQCGVPSDKMVSSGNTSLRTRWESGDGGHRPLHCIHADEVHSCTEEEKGSRYERSYLPTRWSTTPFFRQISGIPRPAFS